MQSDRNNTEMTHLGKVEPNAVRPEENDGKH
jgi:hypothetical protein